MNGPVEPSEPKAGTAFFWKRTQDQAIWVWIGVAFLVFYFGEAILFWEGLALAAPILRLPLAVPFVYPLGYWSLFGLVIYRIQRKASQVSHSAAEKRFLRWQATLLTVGITVGVVGVTYIVMKESGSTKLGHVALFFALFLAAAVIGAMGLNVGWLSAAGLWLLTAIGLDLYPATLNLFPHFRDDDIWIGLAAALGFFLIGGFPLCVDQERLSIQSQD
ncbi:MAG TPA: hypothetical protein VL860_05715 [Planctomycetota bacterium]|nr:hypothetical protein [Planctomycetota bacterium]